jgi:hypothetical protein
MHYDRLLNHARKPPIKLLSAPVPMSSRVVSDQLGDRYARDSHEARAALKHFCRADRRTAGNVGFDRTGAPWKPEGSWSIE